ncbi:MAG TPA: DUF4384 domain-containing protein [Anaeromyxobacteraceae bacterium]|nr:DUF4384 domain-containing protein [Anaeromyxobacteraceae bacterium]
MSPHASELALEVHLVDPQRSGLDEHLRACGACAERLARMAREGEHFVRFVYPRTVDRVCEEGGRRRRVSRFLAWLLPASGLAAAAALLLVSPVPPSDHLGVKGTALSLQAFVGGEGGARALSDGETVSPSALLRFRVAAGSPCQLWLVSVDGKGEVSRLFPPEGDRPAAVRGGTTLPGGAALDGASGPERIFAVCSADPVPLGEIERASRAAAAGGADGIRRAARLSGLPDGAAQASLLVEKGP